jgi:hypothetical protein
VSEPAGSIQMFAASPEIVHAYDANVEREPDVAVTVKVCAPGAIPAYDTGVVHGAGVPPSIEHATDDAFAATNENAAEVDAVVEAGPERMFTVGGGVTVHEYEAVADCEPEIAVTVNEWAPGAMPEYVAGAVHGAGDAPSTEHTVDDAFAEVNEKVADVEVVVEAGPERMFTVGGGVTVHEYDAVADCEPEVAVTVNMWAPGAMPEYVTGVVHGADAEESSEHATAVAFDAAKANDADVDDVVAPGPELIVTAGGGAVGGRGGGAGDEAVTVQVTNACVEPLALTTRMASM